jgi:hypothetical protein
MPFGPDPDLKGWRRFSDLHHVIDSFGMSHAFAHTRAVLRRRSLWSLVVNHETKNRTPIYARPNCYPPMNEICPKPS